MSSLIHSTVLSRLSLLVPSVVLMCFSLTVRAELNVEWIDDNTIIVTGYGYGNETNETVLGSCTNCLAISPAEMAAIKSRISDLLIDLETEVRGGFSLAQLITNRIDETLGDIATFRRFTTAPDGSPTQSDFDIFTNYVYTVDNSQTSLDRQHTIQSGSSARRSIISYNNGIYDYATSVVSPDLSSTRADALSILDHEENTLTKIRAIDSVVSGITEESCSSCGGGSNSSDCSSCPCEEQWDALLDYVKHIDEDQHKRFTQLHYISNRVYNIDHAFDSYAKLVSGVLYNDSTIVLGDDESWTNVYFSGESENYSYDKSNILQRIELILFGMAHSSTNFSSDALSVTNHVNDTSANNVTNQFNDFSSDSTNSFLSAKEKLEAKVNSIKAISSMFVFWGTAGADAPFTLGYVPNLDGTNGGQYIEVGSDFLGSEVSRFRQLCRYGFQLIWATSFLFLIWLFYVRLFKYVVIFLKYAFEWINEAFAS